MEDLENKVCLITGGAGSLGRAIARLFVDRGARVVLADLPGSTLEQTRDDIDGDACLAVSADITQADEVTRLIDTSIDHFGRLDVVVSNAGYFGTIADLETYPEEIFDRAYEVNVKGAFLLCRAAAPHMDSGANIVIVSSVAGLRGDPGVYGYVTAKHAQVGLMRCLAKELAPRGIRVNTLHPGPIDNDFQCAVEDDLSSVIGRDAGRFFDESIPLGRHATADEIAGSALYLASGLSRFTTGSQVVADGGMSA